MNQKQLKSAKELGFVGRTIPMTQDQSKLFITACLAKEQDIAKSLKANNMFVIQVLEKRIKAFELPITFTAKGKLAAMAISDGNPGKMITILIECLTKYEGEEIDDNKLSYLYPMGFYDDNSFINLVDNYFKTRNVKWSEIY